MAEWKKIIESLEKKIRTLKEKSDKAESNEDFLEIEDQIQNAERDLEEAIRRRMTEDE